jgi:hypothetical protein
MENLIAYAENRDFKQPLTLAVYKISLSIRFITESGSPFMSLDEKIMKETFSISFRINPINRLIVSLSTDSSVISPDSGSASTEAETVSSGFFTRSLPNPFCFREKRVSLSQRRKLSLLCFPLLFLRSVLFPFYSPFFLLSVFAMVVPKKQAVEK